MDHITLQDLQGVFAFLALILSIGGTFYTWVASRRGDVQRRFKEGSERMDRLDSRLARAEQTIQGLPSKTDIHAIELHMERLAGSLSRMEAVMDGSSKIMARLETIVTRHEDHLLKGDSR